MTAGRIIERVTGTRFSTYVHETIINRLPFQSATYNSTWAQSSGNLADGFAQTRRDVSSGGGLGWSKSEYEPTAFFIDDEREDILAGPGGVTMSAKDAVSERIYYFQNTLVYSLLILHDPYRRLGYRLSCCSARIQRLANPLSHQMLSHEQPLVSRSRVHIHVFRKSVSQSTGEARLSMLTKVIM